MLEGLIGMGARTTEPEANRIYGVTIAQVANNVDNTGQGRVQLRLPWLPDVEPWARLAVLMAGADAGTYFIPQPGDEVLVAFNHGDIREPFVVGCLWNGMDRPPTVVPTDAVTKRMMRTPLGHQIEFDDAAQEVTIITNTDQRIRLGRTQIELATAEEAATITLDAEGKISINASSEIELNAPSVTIQGNTLELEGGMACDIRATMVRIN